MRRRRLRDLTEGQHAHDTRCRQPLRLRPARPGGRDDTPIAPRPAALDGLRLGILDNSKWNANKLLRGAQASLAKASRFAAVNYT